MPPPALEVVQPDGPGAGWAAIHLICHRPAPEDLQMHVLAGTPDALLNVPTPGKLATPLHMAAVSGKYRLVEAPCPGPAASESGLPRLRRSIALIAISRRDGLPPIAPDRN